MSWTFYNSNGEALIQNAESEATQAEMEAETAVAHFVPPDLVKNSPGVAKVWANVVGTSTAPIRESYNCTFTDTGTGDYLLTCDDTDFATAHYAVVVSGRYNTNDGNQNKFRSPQARAVDTIRVTTTDADSNLQDHLDVMVACYGDQ